MGQIFSDLKGCFGGAPLWNTETTYFLKNYAVVFVLGLIGATPLCKNLWNKVSTRYKTLSTIAEPAYIFLILIAVTACLLSGSLNPFMYFRF